MVERIVDFSEAESREILTRAEFQQRALEATIVEGGLDLVAAPSSKGKRVAILRTSDRILFKRCRRRWGWNSHLRHNLGPKAGISPLWFGSGIHFALEDFHGYNRFGHPVAAFDAYVKATQAHDAKGLPEDWEELWELGKGMLDYYVVWLKQRNGTEFKTFWEKGIPQVEVNFRFPVPFDASAWGYDEVWYSGTIDRICVTADEDQLWPADYKTAASIATLHYSTDPQVSVYMWAVPLMYDMPVGGFLYQQHRKAIPEPGRILKNLQVSVAKDQMTTRALYKQALVNTYGTVEQAPQANQELLSMFAGREHELYDNFVRIDKIGRNERSAQSEGAKILMEAEEMLNPNLPLYPNPTRECATFCPFLSPCVSLDDGGDWKMELDLLMKPRDAVYDSWRKKLKWPGDQPEVTDAETEFSDFLALPAPSGEHL